MWRSVFGKQAHWCSVKSSLETTYIFNGVFAPVVHCTNRHRTNTEVIGKSLTFLTMCMFKSFAKWKSHHITATTIISIARLSVLAVYEKEKNDKTKRRVVSCFPFLFIHSSLISTFLYMFAYERKIAITILFHMD